MWRRIEEKGFNRCDAPKAPNVIMLLNFLHTN